MALPKTFTPFEKVEIGSNILIGGKIPIALDATPILLLGKGVEPKIWLGIPEKNHTVRYLVEDNESRSPHIKVLPKGDAVSVYFDDIIIIQVVKKNDGDVAVTHLDLTPLGLTIKADLDSLTVGTNYISGNTFENVETMINVS